MIKSNNPHLAGGEKIAKNRSTKGTPLQVLAFAIKNWN